MKLLFVYNAKNGILNEAIDFAHKIISPSTYSCDLCMLTHNNFAKRKEWKEFEEKSPYKMQFFHIDDFEKEYEVQYEYPIVLTESDLGLQIIFNKAQIANMKEPEDLIHALENLEK